MKIKSQVILTLVFTLLVCVPVCLNADEWDGGNGNFTDSNWDGGMPHPGIVIDANIELEDDTVQILSGSVNSNAMRIRTVGGVFEVADATLDINAIASLAGLDLGQTSMATGATTASFTNSEVVIAGAGASGRALFVRNGSTLLVDGGSLTIEHGNVDEPFRATMEIESDGLVTITGNASVTTQVLRIDNVSTGLNFESGTIVANNAHPFRGTSMFAGQFNFTGNAGEATLTHTNLSDKNIIRHLAGRVTNRFFAIDGVTIETKVVYDGSNIPAINSELETLAVNGKFLQLEETDGTQVLSLVTEGGKVLKGDVNLDGFVNLLDVNPFIAILTDGGFQAEADVNCDQSVNLLDVAPFVDLLSGN